MNIEFRSDCTAVRTIPDNPKSHHKTGRIMRNGIVENSAMTNFCDL